MRHGLIQEVTEAIENELSAAAMAEKLIQYTERQEK